MIGDLPREPGTYALLLRLDEDTNITVGRLASGHFAAGTYVYVGSARGPGGLLARVARHARQDKALWWHVDYLLEKASLEAVVAQSASEPMECVWAQTLALLPGAEAPMAKFGASDCRCSSHLLYFVRGLSEATFRTVLTAAGADLRKALLEAIGAGDDEASELLVGALVQQDDAFSLVRLLLEHASGDVRLWAIRVCALLGTQEARVTLARRLDDADDPVVCAAALALGHLEAIGAIDKLIQLLGHESAWVQRTAAQALTLMKDAAVPQLVATLKEGSDAARVQAAYALSRLLSDVATEALFQALNDPSHLVRVYAHQALDDMGMFDIVVCT